MKGRLWAFALVLVAGCAGPAPVVEEPEVEAAAKPCTFTLYLSEEGWSTTPPKAPVEHDWPLNPVFLGVEETFGDLILPILDPIPTRWHALQANMLVRSDSGTVSLLPTPVFGFVDVRELPISFVFPGRLEGGHTYQKDIAVDETEGWQTPREHMSLFSTYPTAASIDLKAISYPPGPNGFLGGTTHITFLYC